MSHLTLTPFLIAQIIGFPIAFLARATVRLWRSRKGSASDQWLNRMEAAANACFAWMAIAFAFNRPAGVMLLIVGIGLNIAAHLPKMQQKSMQDVPSSPSIRNSKLARGRKPSKQLA